MFRDPTARGAMLAALMAVAGVLASLALLRAGIGS